MEITVAMGQMRVETGAVEANLDRAVAMMAEASARDCDLVVLPECLDLGWTCPEARERAEPIPGRLSRRLAEACRRLNVGVAAGLTEREADRVYNAAVFIDRSGVIRVHHRKINELVIGQAVYDIGNRLEVAATEWGTVAVDICADNFPSSLAVGHVLARMGAEMLLSPSAWAVPPNYDPVATPYGEIWETAYRELARLYDLTIVGVSAVGQIRGGAWNGHHLIGSSLAVGPEGVLARAPYGADQEALVPVTVRLRPPIGRGTTFAEALRARGYRGP